MITEERKAELTTRIETLFAKSPFFAVYCALCIPDKEESKYCVDCCLSEFTRQRDFVRDLKRAALQYEDKTKEALVKFAREQQAIENEVRAQVQKAVEALNRQLLAEQTAR